jgi:acetyltransferase-like isoleucine patch superfamily enzyme
MALTFEHILVKMIMRFGSEASVNRALRRLGMRIGEGTRYYSMRLPGEPWLVRIGERCLIASDVTFITHDANTVFQHKYESLTSFGRIDVKDNTYIGVNATILPNVTIGPNAVVGACAVVTKDVPPEVVVAGNPARVVCTLAEYEAKCAAGHLDVPKDRRALRKALEEHFWGKSA